MDQIFLITISQPLTMGVIRVKLICKPMNLRLFHVFSSKSTVSEMYDKLSSDLSNILHKSVIVKSITTRDHYALVPSEILSDLLDNLDTVIVYVREFERDDYVDGVICEEIVPERFVVGDVVSDGDGEGGASDVVYNVGIPIEMGVVRCESLNTGSDPIGSASVRNRAEEGRSNTQARKCKRGESPRTSREEFVRKDGASFDSSAHKVDIKCAGEINESIGFKEKDDSKRKPVAIQTSQNSSPRHQTVRCESTTTAERCYIDESDTKTHEKSVHLSDKVDTREIPKSSGEIELEDRVTILMDKDIPQTKKIGKRQAIMNELKDVEKLDKSKDRVKQIKSKLRDEATIPTPKKRRIVKDIFKS